MIIVEIFIFCSPIGRRHPFNLICLLIFTLCEAWVVSYSTSYVIYVYDDATTVVVAACMTLGSSKYIYSHRCRTDSIRNLHQVYGERLYDYVGHRHSCPFCNANGWNSLFIHLFSCSY